jgi:putative ABC transport system substrate-binding protein
MPRRDFIGFLASAAVLWPLGSRAQPGMRRIGVLAAAADNPIMGPAYRAFLDELRTLGFEQGQNLAVEHRSTERDFAALSADARELVRGKVDALVALGAEPSLKACIEASRSIPIVFVANISIPSRRDT